jgi:glutamate--cysteine ligase
MARDVSDTTPVTSREDLVEWLESGSKPADRFAIGTEHEKIPFYRTGHTAVPYLGEPGAGRCGIRALLEGMRADPGWAAIYDGPNIIGLYQEKGGAAISLEPGGQFELSGAPLATIHETDAELDAHLRNIKSVAERCGISFLTLGMNPKQRLAEIPMMPKQRYAIMAKYMPKVGARGLDMMFRTATVQANLDFSSEADMVRKLKISLALQPVATALFANSPFADGKLNGFLSARSEIWRETDAARTGMLPFAFEPGMGFERYVDYALDVPMYFLKRGETYVDVAGASFRDLLDGRFKPAPGERATYSDWANHLSTTFPEVRLKRYLEMRGADAGPQPMLTALPALFAGLLYDTAALDQALELIRPWTAADREKLRADAPRLGLDASIAGRPLREVARDVLGLARAGLARRKRLDSRGRDETCFLDPLDVIAAGRTEAERLIEAFQTRWGGSVEPAFGVCVY